MQDVEDNIDDLFKRVADKYPLKTDTFSWESVQRKLHASTAENARIIDKNLSGKVRKGVLIGLIVMLPVGLLITQHFTRNTNETNVGANAGEGNIKSTNKSEMMRGIETNNNMPKRGNTAFNQVDAKVINNRAKIKLAANHEGGFYNGVKKINEAENTSNQLLVFDNLNNNDKDNQKRYAPLINANETVVKKVTPGSITSFVSVENIQKSEVTMKTSDDITTKVQQSEVVRLPTANKSKRFYLGVILAPELTSVKFQPVKKVSFNQGILMGYRLNTKLNLEVGFTLAHKYYYTEGKYLASNSIRRDNSNILKVNAYNNITEIPVTLRYNLKQSANGKIFAGIGAVSYIIHKEQYSYVYSKNGQEQTATKYNNKASKYWFSNAQLSLGYERSAGKVGDVRVEPYYRIPLHGIGLSNLPVTGVGLNIALTKSLK